MPLIAPDILDRSTQNILTLYTPDTTHSKHITELALTMFDAWKDYISWTRIIESLLKTAALLHDIGITHQLLQPRPAQCVYDPKRSDFWAFTS